MQTLAMKGIWKNNLCLIKTGGGFDHNHFPQRKKHLSYVCLKTEKKGGGGGLLLKQVMDNFKSSIILF